MTNKTLTSPVLNGTISGDAFLDEDNMASDSATKLASQQSIKAYVDSIAGTTNEIDVSSLTIGIADNPVLPGTDAFVPPTGTTAQRSTTTDGAIRFNSTLDRWEGYKTSKSDWTAIGGGGVGSMSYIKTYKANDDD
jgi:hypothetical protein